MDGSTLSVLPVEVQKIIMTALDDRSRRMMRSTSSYWFNIVKYDYYEFYFVTPAILTDLVEKFSGYDKPFGLGFKKTKSPDESFTILASLTNLTRLEIEPDRKKRDMSPDLAVRFSTLTNLQRFAFYGLDITPNLQSFQNLKYLYRYQPPQTKNKPLDLAELKFLTKLQKVGIEMPILTEKYDITSQFGNVSALKAIEFIDQDQNWRLTTFDPELVSKMSQVSYLQAISLAFFPFSKLPNLESLYLRGIQFDSITSLTKLTELTVYINTNAARMISEDLKILAKTYDYQQLTALTNLRCLILMAPLIDEQYSFLTALTNLEFLCALPSEHETLTGQYLQFINSSKLTHIEMQSLDDITYLSHLTNLQSFVADDIKSLENVSKATFELKNVTNVFMKDLSVMEVFPNVKRLRIVDYGVQLKDSWKLLALTKLELLSLSLIDSQTLQMVSTMTNLTHFSAQLDTQSQYEFEVLSHLTALKVLSLWVTNVQASGTPPATLWQAIEKMTDLESLSLFHLSYDCISTLENLPKLKSLRVTCKELKNFGETALSRLTNLQQLHLSDGSFYLKPHECKLNLPYLYSCTK